MNWRSKLSITLAVITLLLFVWISSAFVVSEGVCCADDSSNAVLAKNLAWGHGYAHSIDYSSGDFSLRLFHGVMTSSVGPTIILPTSMAIWVFGNKYWVPGASQILVWLIVLLAIYRVLWVATAPEQASATLTIFLVLVYLFSPRHFGHWYMLLGEVPQILLVILAVLIWSEDPLSKFRLPVASFLIGLSVLTKILSIIYAALFLLSVALWYFRYDKRFGDTILKFFWAAIWVFLPILCFEVWKLATLGVHLYAKESVEFFRFIKGQGISADKSSLLQRLTERSQNFYENFGVSLSELLLLAGFSVFLSVRLGSPFVRRFAVILFAGAVIHAGYWFTMSVGWPRYYYSGLVLLSFLISTPMLILKGRKEWLLYMLAVFILGIGAAGRIMVPPVSHLLWSAPAGSLPEPQALVSQFLNSHMDRRPFFGSWGGSIADLEYLSNGVLNFKGWHALQPQDYERGFLLVTYDRFDNYAPDYQEFKAFLSRCGSPVVNAPPYAVYDCKGLQP